MIPSITYALAPICLFVYKRLDTLQRTVSSLQQNELASKSDLFIFSDAAGKATDENAVNEVRSFCRNITGFKSVSIIYAERSLGLAVSIIKGVSAIIERYEKIIVLEDDLVLSTNFLSFMNEALRFYKNNSQVFSITGYTAPLKYPSKGEDVYFTKRGCSWGWATWKHKWSDIDWNVSDYENFIHNKKEQQRFNLMGSDLTGSLKRQQEGKINSWAIRWVYEQFKRNEYSVFPMISKVANDGFGTAATHTSKSNRTRFSTILDTSERSEFTFLNEPYLNPKFVKQYTDRYSIKIRAWYKLKSILNLA